MTAPSPFRSFKPGGEDSQPRFRTPSFAKPVEDEAQASAEPQEPVENAENTNPEPVEETPKEPESSSETDAPSDEEQKAPARTRRTRKAAPVEKDTAKDDDQDSAAKNDSDESDPQHVLSGIIASVIESQPPKQALATLEALKSGLDTATSLLDQHLTTVNSLVKGLR